MSFSKAFQKQGPIPGQEEYVEAYNKYCAQCSVYKRLKARLDRRTDDAAELQMFRMKKEFSTACREYNTARTKWIGQQVEYKLRAKGLESKQLLTMIDFAKVMGVQTANSHSELMELHKHTTAGMSISEEEFDAIAKAAMAYKSRRVFSPVETDGFNTNLDSTLTTFSGDTNVDTVTSTDAGDNKLRSGECVSNNNKQAVNDFSTEI